MLGLLNRQQRVFSQASLDARFRNGMLAHWIGGCGGGSTWFDQSGQGNHASFVSVSSSFPSWTNGVNDKRFAVSFDGSGTYANAGATIAALANPTDLTLACWVYRRSNVFSCILGYRTSSGWIIGWDASANMQVYDGGNFITSSVVVPLNEWCHLAYVQNPVTSNIDLYVNGTFRASISSSLHNGDGPVTIGAYAGGGFGKSNAIFDDVRLYSRKVSPSEIATFSDRNFSPVISSVVRITKQRSTGNRIRRAITAGGS